MKQNIAFGITLIRGLLAVVFGLVLFFQPDKTRPILGNFIGMLWLASRIISLRWGATGERARDSALLAGVIGLLAGLAMLTRGLTSAYIAREFIFSLIGGVMALTGILHAFGGSGLAKGAIAN